MSDSVQEIPIVPENLRTIPLSHLRIILTALGMLLTIVIAAFAGAINFSLNVNEKLARLEVKVDAVTDVKSRVSTLESAINGHLSDPKIHHALTHRVEDLEKRIDRMENQRRAGVDGDIKNLASELIQNDRWIEGPE